MVDIIATLFRFRQFVFEYGPFFLAAWLGLAVITGLIAATQRQKVDLRVPSSPFLKYKLLGWMWRLLFFLLWRPGGKMPILSAFSGPLLFSFTASVPALVSTSLIGMKAVLLRLILTALFTLSLSWFVTSVISHKPESFRGQRPEVETLLPSSVLKGDTSALPPSRLHSLAQVSWKSFTGQVEGAAVPLIISFILASALTIYIPVYAIRPWLGDGAWQGPYLAALLAIPFQFAGGAEVPLASALLVKGASLGTVLSIMLVAPSTTFFVIRRLYQSMGLKAIALYLVAAWLVAGSLGAAVDGVQQILSG